MKVFISWSEERGRVVAEGLQSWLGDVLHRVDPWVSSKDIDPGIRWNVELAQQLQETRFGIICLTPESVNKPWILFEAGALAKTLDKARVCPYLVDMDHADLKAPLDQFEAVRADKLGTLRLLRSINRALEPEGALPDARLIRCFERAWPDLEGVLKGIPARPVDPYAVAAQMGGLGVAGVFRSRSDALPYFKADLDNEIHKPRGRREIRFVCTSLRVLRIAANFDGRQLLQECVDKKCLLHILLMDPKIAVQRERQEHRSAGAIAGEIWQTVRELKEWGVPAESVRFYRGSPTVFGIATSEAMLLNPYPYEFEGHRCMTIIVRSTGVPDDIYQQYIKHHFIDPWENAVPLSGIGKDTEAPRRGSKATPSSEGRSATKRDTTRGR